MNGQRLQLLLWACIVSALPVASLVGVAVAYRVPGLPVAALAVASIVVARWAVAYWNRDIVLLAETARRVGWSTLPEPGPRRTALASTGNAGDEIARLATKLSERASLIETLLGAEEAIVERLPDPLILLGRDRSVRRANEAARHVFGAEIAAVLRHPRLRIAIEAALPEPGALRPAAGPTAERVEISLALPVPRDVVATVISFVPPLPGGGSVLVVLSDRTRERAIERTRSDFIANASHELRTPLTSLIGFIETLRGPAADDPPAQSRFLGIMAEQAARMNRLIDDLLSLSRIEISEHQPPQTVVELMPLLARVAAGFEPRVAERGQHLELRLSPDLPPVLGDADQLVQVFANLLDNACKYGREGGTIALVAASAESETIPARPGVALSVADDGPGIARVHLPRLTERFYRADAGRGSGGRLPGGTGLGLAIVKHIVNRHRGVLRIESEPGRGATFRVWLPAG